MIPNKHGGGPHGTVTVTDGSAVVVQPLDKLRNYLEIQNGGDTRCHIAISDTIDAVYGSGLYMDPGAVYTVGFTNLTPARITAICDTGASTTLNFQVGR